MKKIVSILILVFSLVGSMFANDNVIETVDVIDGVEYKFVGYTYANQAYWDLEKWLVKTYDIAPRSIKDLYDTHRRKCFKIISNGNGRSTEMSNFMLKNNLEVACEVCDTENTYYITTWFIYNGETASYSTIIEH